MNWSSIKNIMLVLFLIVNVFLLIVFGFTQIRQLSLPEGLNEAAVSILEKDGFSCSEDVFPARYMQADSLGASFYSPNELSQMLFNKDVPFRAEGDMLIAQSDDATLIVNGQYFEYYTNTTPIFASQNKVKKALSRIGFNMKNSLFNKEADAFNLYHKEHPLFDMFLSADLNDKNSFAYIKGFWPAKIEVLESNISAAHITQFVPSFKNVFSPAPLQSITLGYRMQDAAGTAKYFKLIPSWKVSASDGQYHFFE